ncbi:molybdate ABC transporter substrate-binding protein [Nitriliruptoraceae bacterium ZYF776]|nr:molybdate ABC transporter substrate-binding protein [Profundirhabdus halotolerans]
MRWLRAPRAVVVAALLLTACGGSGVEGASAVGSDGTASLSGELRVFAAASLTDAFEELARRMEADHPDLDVVNNSASSSTLATQLTEGAAADVFASADDTQMQVVVDEGLANGPTTFASNLLAIAVEPGNPLGITGLSDLARDDVVLVLAAPEVPAGQYAAEALQNAGVEVSPSSLEVDVRATLGKVTLGEADAAIVYASDIVGAGDAIEGVDLPVEDDVVATYPVVALGGAPNPEAARAFVELLLGDGGQAVLADHGFGAP